MIKVAPLALVAIAGALGAYSVKLIDDSPSHKLAPKRYNDALKDVSLDPAKPEETAGHDSYTCLVDSRWVKGRAAAVYI